MGSAFSGRKGRVHAWSSMMSSTSSVPQENLPAWIRPRPSWKRATCIGLSLSTQLVIWAWAVAVVCLAPWVFYRLQQLKLDVDLQAKEPVYSLTEICRRRDKFGAISRIWCHDFEFGNFPVVMPILMFPAVAFAIIVKLGALRTTILLTTQVAVYILVMGFYLSPDEERAEMQGILGQLAFILPTIILFLFSPRNSHIWLASLGLVAVSGLGLFLMEAYDVLKGMGDLIFLCMMWPIIREFFYFAARKTARFAAMSPDFGGGAIEVRRRYAWSLVLVIQVFLATWFRLMATKINDRTRYIIFLMLSSIQEIVFRVTIRERENLLASAARFRSLRRSESGTFRDRRNSVVAPVSQRRVSKTSHKVSHELAETEWYAMLSLGEMLAEHLALWLVLGLILISRGSVLTLPLPFFNELEHPFDDKPNIKPYILLTFGQLIAEILVDCICVTLEQRMHGYPLQVIWQVMSFRVRFINLALASFTGLSLALTLFFEAETGTVRTQWCTDIDICSCKPPENNLYGQYCTYMNSSYTQT